MLEQLRKLKTEVDGLVGENNKPAGAAGKLWETKVKACPVFKKVSTQIPATLPTCNKMSHYTSYTLFSGCCFQSDVVEDIVIQANPASPPLSLVILHGMLSQQFSVFSTCFTHSSVLNVKATLKSCLGEPNGVSRNAADMAVSLIWKQGKQTITIIAVCAIYNVFYQNNFFDS